MQVGVGVALELDVGVGQAANSHFGPVLPTLVPSGQSFASIVQAACFVVFLLKTTTYPITAIAIQKETILMPIPIVFR